MPDPCRAWVEEERLNRRDRLRTGRFVRACMYRRMAIRRQCVCVQLQNPPVKFIDRVWLKISSIIVADIFYTPKWKKSEAMEDVESYYLNIINEEMERIESLDR